MHEDPQPPTQDAAAAVTRLVQEQGGKLYQLALRFCGDREQAQDLVQEVFMQAYRAWDSFRGQSDVKTWLYRIAARACQRMHRKRAGEPDHLASTDELLPFGESRIGIIPAEQDDLLQQQIHAEARQRLEAQIALLPDDFRIPLVLKEIVGLGINEVADVLGLEQGTVRSRLHRARLKLRQAIDSAIPRKPGQAPAPAYDRQTCMDLLDAKQQALDRGVPFADQIICERCRSMFASLDLTQSLCRKLADGAMPAELRDKLARQLKNQE